MAEAVLEREVLVVEFLMQEFASTGVFDEDLLAGGYVGGVLAWEAGCTACYAGMMRFWWGL